MRSLVTLVLSALALFSGLAVAAGSAGCNKTSTSGIQNGLNRVTINGKQRQYTVRLPSNYSPTKQYKFIFTLHWLNGNMNAVVTGNSIQPYYGLPQRDTNNSAIYVAPDGLNQGWQNTNGEDVTFLSTILTTAKNNYCIDESKVFSTGWSFGGAMSYSLSCSLGSVLRGIAVLSASPYISGCAGGGPKDPVAYLGFHGTHDSVLAISNGEAIRDNYVKMNGCTPMTNKYPARGSNSHVKNVYSGCKAGYPTTFIAFDGDHTPVPADNGGGINQSYAPDETWAFINSLS
jgi:poly(3-hydroxybutyrate) depolymerase